MTLMKARTESVLLFTWQVLLAAILLTGCVTERATSRPANRSSERTQIERRLNEVFDAAEKKDFARLDSYHLYGPGFTKFSASPPGRQDAAASRRSEHEGLGAISDLKMHANDLKIDVFGNVAIATFILESSFKAAGNAYQKLNQGTLVFVKNHGNWKITHEHFSPSKTSP
jgi:ketosteroid isomerase-like protein